jgi:hypothetical protein
MTFYARITTEDNDIYFFSVEDTDIEQAKAQVNHICFYMFARLPKKVLIKSDDSGLSNRSKNIISKYPVSIDKKTHIITGDMLDYKSYIELKYDYTNKD